MSIVRLAESLTSTMSQDSSAPAARAPTIYDFSQEQCQVVIECMEAMMKAWGNSRQKRPGNRFRNHMPPQVLTHVKAAIVAGATVVKQKLAEEKQRAIAQRQAAEAEALVPFLAGALALPVARRPLELALDVTPNGYMKIRCDGENYMFNDERWIVRFEGTADCRKLLPTVDPDKAPPKLSLRTLAARALARSLPSLDVKSRRYVASVLFPGSKVPPAKRKVEEAEEADAGGEKQQKLD